MKQCTTCGETKPLEAFDRVKRSNDTRIGRCKQCGLARRQALAQSRSTESKFCSRCDTLKPATDFHRNRSTRDGLQSYCKACSADIQRDYMSRNADLVALRNAKKLLQPVSVTRTKVCKVCEQEKPLLEFYANRGTADRRAIYCKLCSREYERVRRGKKHDAYLASQKKWRDANREKRKELMRNWNLRVYGLTPDDYLDMYEAQGGVCLICGEGGESFGGRRLNVDHDHKTGNVRGLLCGLCNSALGKFKDSPELLRRAASYLEVAT